MNKIIVFTSLPGFTSALEATMILLAIPEISKEFDISYSESTLLIIIFVIIETLFVVPFSLIADKNGIKKMMIIGSLIMMIASILIFISNNFIIMLLLRAFQGLGGSMVILTSLSYASLISLDINRGRSIGLNHTIISLGYVVGLPLGGLMASINYKYLFLFTAFLSLLSIILIINIDEIKGRSEIRRSSFYITLLFSGLILSIYYIPFIIIAVIGLILSFKIRLNKEFSLSSFSGFLHSITRNMLAAYFVFLLYSLKYTSLIIGLLVLIYPLFFTVTSFVSGKLYDKYGLKIAALGFLSMSVFSLLLLFDFIVPEIFLGSSTGVATTSNTAYTMKSLNKNDRITGSGIRSLQGIVTNAIGLGITSKLMLDLNYIIIIIITLNIIALIITLILVQKQP
ncbi:MFS transporter [Picrophilus oshimae]|nr:MFS transporter [Picrophilus oshimae]